jgi:hypothetical protein
MLEQRRIRHGAAAGGDDDSHDDSGRRDAYRARSRALAAATRGLVGGAVSARPELFNESARQRGGQ